MFQGFSVHRLALPLFAIILVVLVTGCGGAPVVGSTQADPPRTISVTGYGEAQGNPDIAQIMIGVNIINENVGDAVNEVNETIERITTSVVAMGVSETDIQTAAYTVWPEERYSPETGFPTGQRLFHVDSTIQLKVREVSRLGEILQAALQVGANNVYGISFGIDDPAPLTEQARLDAIEDARQRASQLADGLGASLGKPVLISEGVVGPIIYAPVSIEGKYGVGGGAPVTPGQTTIGVQVQVTFELVR